MRECVRGKGLFAIRLLRAMLWMLLSAGSISSWPVILRANGMNQCGMQTFESIKLVVCSLEHGSDELRLFWKDRDGAPYKSFARLAENVATDGKRLSFAINGGMYSETFEPVGLYVEDGKEQRAANTTAVQGSSGSVPNFYKKPNGVFFLTGEGPGS